MPPHYSIQLGRWTDSDDDDETGFANEGLDALGSNPYDEPPGVPGPMPARPDMEFSLEESERNARPDMEFSLEDSENNMFGKPDMEFSPEEVDLDDEVRRGVQELDAPPVKQQTFRPAMLADGGELPQSRMAVGPITTKRPLRPDEWDTTSLPEALARDSVRPVSPRARQNLETGGGMGEPAPLEEKPEAGAWADYGALSRPDETWAGAEAPLRREAPAQSLAPSGPPGPMPAPPPDLAPPQQRQPVGPSQIRYDTSARPGVTADLDGGQPDQVGVETENPDPLEARLKRGRELYIQKFGGAESPVDEQPTYTPHAPEGYRQTDGDMQRAYIMNLIGGGAGQAQSAVGMLRGLNHDYDTRNQNAENQNLQRWLAEHKMREDNGPISMAEVQQLIMSGVEPEAAVHAGRGATKLASSLGGIATRERKIDADTKKTVIGEREKDLRQERDQDFKGQLFERSDETKRYGAESNERLWDKKNAGAEEGRDDYVSAAVSSLSNLTPEQAREFVTTGTARGATPEQIADAKNALGVASRLPAERLQKFASDAVRNEASARDKPIVAARTKELDPGSHKDRVKIREELSTADRTVDGALSGYDELSKNPRALDLFVKMGQSSGSGLLSKATFEAKLAQLSPQEQAAAGRIMTALSRTAFNEGGKNLTSAEMGMFGAKSGVTLGAGAAIFRDPAVLRQYLATMNKARHSYRKNVQAEYGDLGAR